MHYYLDTFGPQICTSGTHVHFTLRLFPTFLLKKAQLHAVSPPERCNMHDVRLEKVHRIFEVCLICRKGVVFYNTAQCRLYTFKVSVEISVIITESSI